MSERSWQVRYDYDFKDTMFNGLKSIERYYYGHHIQTLSGLHDGTEKELDFILNYDFQQPPLKDLGFSWLFANYKYSMSKDYVENRVALYYNKKI